jgi:hypothetical protein
VCGRRSSLRRLIEARRGLTEPFDDKTADQAAPLWQAALAEAQAITEDAQRVAADLDLHRRGGL